MAEAEITVRDDGPYLVRGTVRLIDADGERWELEGETVALCRCGQSRNKPFCDASHKSGFQSCPRARGLDE